MGAEIIYKSIKLSYRNIICILVILSLGLISNTWFGGNYLISAGDFNFFLSLQKNIFLRSYMNLGFSPCALFAFLPLTIFEWGGFTLVGMEKIMFYFLFTFPGLSMYFLTTSAIKGERRYFAGVISAFFYMMNMYTWLIEWGSGYVMSLFAYGALPLMLALYIKGLNEKSNKKYAIFVGVVSLLAAPSGSTLTYLVVIWFVLLLYLIFHIVSKRQKPEIFRSLRFTVLSFVTWFLLNLWWIVNEITNSGFTLSQTLSSDSYISILRLNSTSTSFLNILRLMGFWGFQGEFRGDLYCPVSPIYSSFLFVLISFLIPLLAFGSLLTKGKKKNILFFALLSIIGLFLIKGIHPPLGNIYDWLFFNLPGFSIFRSPYQKWGVLVALGYAFTIAFTLSELYYSTKVRKTIHNISRIFVFLLCIAIFCVYLFPFWTGDIFPPQSAYTTLKSSRMQVPIYYNNAGNWLDQQSDSFGMFSLPYDKTKPNAYLWGWIGYSGSDPIFIISEKSVPLTNQFFTDYRNQENISKVLGLLNTKYIILHDDADWEFYGTEPPASVESFLKKQKGISLEESFGKISFYKIADENFVPKIYPANHVFLVDGGSDEMFNLVASDQFQSRSVVFLLNQTGERTNLVQNNVNMILLTTETINVTVHDIPNELFSWAKLPNNGVQAIYYEGWKNTINTDGSGNDTTLSFSSLKQCPYEFPSFSSLGWNTYNSTLVYIRNGDKPLTIRSIHEGSSKTEDVIGVWWETGWMGMSTKALTFPIVIPENQRAIIQIAHKAIGNITLSSIKLEDLRSSTNPEQNRNLQITFKSINPTHYEIKIKNASHPFFIVFSESYNPLWKVYAKDSYETFNDVIAKYDNLKVDEARPEAKLALGDISYLFAVPLNDSYHFIANGYVNAWYVDPAQIDKNGDGSFAITFYFLPQSLFYLGLIISGMTFVVCVGYLAYDWKFRKNKRDIEKNKVPLDWNVCRKRVSYLDLTENSRILDIGSKDGKKAHYVINKGQLIMSDITSRKNNSPFVLSDATSLPFRNDSFDLVTIFHVMEHIKNDKTVLKEIYRILKKNGTVLIVTPNANRFAKIYSFVLKIVKRSPYKYPMNPDHVFEYGASDIENIMKNSEFQCYTIEPIFMKISIFLRIRKYCDQWIVTAKK